LPDAAHLLPLLELPESLGADVWIIDERARAHFDTAYPTYGLIPCTDLATVVREVPITLDISGGQAFWFIRN
jgi:hypothetical protein